MIQRFVSWNVKVRSAKWLWFHRTVEGYLISVWILAPFFKTVVRYMYLWFIDINTNTHVSDCIGCAVLLCFVVCMTLLA